MAVYETPEFQSLTKKDKSLTRKSLLEAVDRLDAGSIDANLGGNIYKQRVAAGGKGKRGGSRILLAFKQGEHTFLVNLFAKSDQDNITDKQLDAMKAYAKLLFDLSDAALETAVKEAGFRKIRD